jgi:arsenate reductase (glutaredoxin)
MIRIYHNPRCSKSRFALNHLKNNGSEFSTIEYLNVSFTEESLGALLEKLQMNPTEIIRTNEVDFKEKFSGKVFTNEEWIKILIENPKLIQRPIVEMDSRACIAREVEVLNQFLGNK